MGERTSREDHHGSDEATSDAKSTQHSAAASRDQPTDASDREHREREASGHEVAAYPDHVEDVESRPRPDRDDPSITIPQRKGDAPDRKGRTERVEGECREKVVEPLRCE